MRACNQKKTTTTAIAPHKPFIGQHLDMETLKHGSKRKIKIEKLKLNEQM
jgi:hypothetical protein